MSRKNLNLNGTYAVGVDVGGTNVRAGIIAKDGAKLGEGRRPAMAQDGLEATQQMIIEAIEEAVSKAGVDVKDMIGIGMGVPGRHDSVNGIVHYSPNFKGWVEVDLLSKFEEYFNVAAFMKNDVKTASMGEYRFGAGKGYNWVVMITLGTGIGGSLIANGQLMLGSGEGFAEVGHMTVSPNGRKCGCGNHGCWEAMASRDAIIERASLKLQTGRPSSIGKMTNFDISAITPAVIAEAANDGDELAKEVLEETGMWVGIGVANLVQLYNPEIFIIGGGISQAGDLLFGAIRRTVSWRGNMVPIDTDKIVPAGLGDDAGIYGGASLVYSAAEIK